MSGRERIKALERESLQLKQAKEILRDPQGTQFGRNTQGGAINVIPNMPSFKHEFSPTAGAGSHGYWLGEVIVNGALSIPWQADWPFATPI